MFSQKSCFGKPTRNESNPKKHQNNSILTMGIFTSDLRIDHNRTFSEPYYLA